MSFWFLVDALFLLAGCYGLVLAVKVKRSGKLEDIRHLIPQYAQPSCCKDAPAFIRKILPWLVVFGVATVINGILGMLQDLQVAIPQALYAAAMVFFVAAAAAFLKTERDAIVKYWGEENLPDQVGKRSKEK